MNKRIVQTEKKASMSLSDQIFENKAERKIRTRSLCTVVVNGLLHHTDQTQRLMHFLQILHILTPQLPIHAHLLIELVNILTRVCHPTTNQLTYLPDPYGFIPHRLSHTMCTCVADVQRDMVGGATPPLSLTHEVMIGGGGAAKLHPGHSSTLITLRLQSQRRKLNKETQLISFTPKSRGGRVGV